MKSSPRKTAVTRLVFVVMLFACTGQETGTGHVFAGSGSTDIQGQCESALDTAAASSIRDLPPPDTAWQFALPEQLGNVASLDWDTASDSLFVLDQVNSRVAVVARDGRVLRWFGREGRGPSDLDFGPIRHRRTRLALAGDSAIVVADLHSVKFFTRTGGFRWGSVVDTTGGGSVFDLSIAVTPTGQVIASKTGKLRLAAQDMDTRTALDLIRLVPSREGVTQQPLLRLRNSYATLDSFLGTPPQQPYRDSYHRSWGIAGDRVTFISWKVFGVCHTDFSGQLLNVTRLDAKRIPIDDAERQRVLQQEQGGGDTPLPFLGVTGRQLYEDRWPEAGPVYQDILVDGGGRAVALRRIQGGQSMLDLYSARAYQGSFSMPSDYALGLFKSGLLVLVRTADAHVLALRLPEDLTTLDMESTDHE